MKALQDTESKMCEKHNSRPGSGRLAHGPVPLTVFVPIRPLWCTATTLLHPSLGLGMQGVRPNPALLTILCAKDLASVSSQEEHSPGSPPRPQQGHLSEEPGHCEQQVPTLPGHTGAKDGVASQEFQAANWDPS